LFAALAAGRLSAQAWDGYWTDIGTLAQLSELNRHAGNETART
jgi:NDP-sugar pyrophosphorylase family protein